MKTADEVLQDFGLYELERLPKSLLFRRIRALAEYVETYERSFDQLSQTLQKRTRKLRDAEDREAATAGRNEDYRIQLAMHQHLLDILFVWEANLGSTDEAQSMADLREAITAHRYRIRD